MLNARPLIHRVAAALAKHRLEAILIGNAAAALQGAPVTTLDLDFMFRDTPLDRKKLKAVADELRALTTRLPQRASSPAPVTRAPPTSLVRLQRGHLASLRSRRTINSSLPHEQRRSSPTATRSATPRNERQRRHFIVKLAPRCVAKRRPHGHRT
jgi:hypothetical protein